MLTLPLSQAQKLKSMRNRRDYVRRKYVRSQQEVTSTKEQVATLSDDVVLLKDLDDRRVREVEALETALKKSQLKLDRRSERWSQWRDKMVHAISQLRSRHSARIDATEKEYNSKLKKHQSAIYNLQRSHVKDVVRLENKASQLKRGYE